MKFPAFAMYLTNNFFLIVTVSNVVFSNQTLFFLSNQTLMKRETIIKFEFDFIRI